jgi:hypothetical protein
MARRRWWRRTFIADAPPFLLQLRFLHCPLQLSVTSRKALLQLLPPSSQSLHDVNQDSTRVQRNCRVLGV